MVDEERSLYSPARDPYGFSRALTAWKRGAHDEPSVISVCDNAWAQTQFMVELLLHAKARRKWLDPDRAAAILREAGSSVELSSLEERYWVRFVVNHLEIPGAIRGELRQRQHDAELNETEREALEVLRAARDEKSPLFWVEKDELGRIHAAYANAHSEMPSLAELGKMRIFVAAEHEGVLGYLLPWRNSGEGGVSEWQCTRVLGLYWEALVRKTPKRVEPDVDDAIFSKWLVAAFEFRWFGSPTQFVVGDLRNRLTKAAKRRVLAETDVVGFDEEVERFRWEVDGFDRRWQPRILAKPEAGATILEVYRWFDGSGLVKVQGYRSIRQNLDLIVSLVRADQSDAWHNDLLEIVRASRGRPYFAHAFGLHACLSGLVANADTASLGMRHLSVLRPGRRDRFSWETPEQTTQSEERERNIVWRAAIRLALGALVDHLAEAERLHFSEEETNAAKKEAAIALGEILLLSVPMPPRSRRHLPGVDDALEAGAEERIRLVFHELEDSCPAVLFPLMPNLLSFFERQVGLAKLRILLWLLRVLVSARGVRPIEPDVVATSLVVEYQQIFLRYGDPWRTDRLEMAALPWIDLAMFLERKGLARQLLAPDGVDFENKARENYNQNQYAGGDEHLSWIRRTRFHLRVLFKIHEDLLRVDFDPALGLRKSESDALLQAVEERIHDTVTMFASSAHEGKHGSLFDPDKQAMDGGVRGSEGLLHPLIQVLNQFVGSSRREKSFLDWLDTENEPVVLLTVLEVALPVSARELSMKRLGSFEIAHLDSRMGFTSIPQWEEVALAANIAGQKDIVTKVLDYGDEHFRGDYGMNQWAFFSYRMRLMLAYHDKDLEKLDAVKEPPNPERYRQHMNLVIQDQVDDTREFYRGLILMDKDFTQARAIFADLWKRYPDQIAHAINLFSASFKTTEVVEHPEERHQEFLRLSHDLEALERNLPSEALASVRSQLVCLRLMVLDGARRDLDFDALWLSLEPNLRIDLAILTIGVNNSRRRGLPERATDLLRHAQPSYFDANGRLNPKFVQIGTAPIALQDLRLEMIQAAGNEEALHKLYLSLAKRDAAEAAHIVAGSSVFLHRYLYDHLRAVAVEFLKRRQLFQPFRDEDKYNDVLVSLLSMRLQFMGWSVSDQTRQGASQTGKKVGEIDWVVRNDRGGFAIFEALRIDSLKVDYVNEHVGKAIYNYNPHAVPQIYIIVYYHGKTWADFWTKYQNHVVIEPIREGLLPSVVEEVDNGTRDHDIRALRLEYTRDGSRLVVYHLALNLKS